MRFGNVPSRLIHPDADYSDDCFVRVIAEPHSGSARPLVMCVYDKVTTHVDTQALEVMFETA